jgi:nucleoside permease NupC
MFLIILLIMLAIVSWVSYYTSASVYRSLVKKDNPNARAFQVLIFVLMFAALIGLLYYFVATSLVFQR